jgi:hypothetical protein
VKRIMKPTTKRRQNRQREGMEIVEGILSRHRWDADLGDERTVRRLVDEALGADRVKAAAAMKRLNWSESTGGAISEITDDEGETVAYGRTPQGQVAYDVLCSSMSGAEVLRRHPEAHLTRAFVLDMRRRHRHLRRRPR